jgi:glycosyltransferase involved in cell wall biosynthesis
MSSVIGVMIPPAPRELAAKIRFEGRKLSPRWTLRVRRYSRIEGELLRLAREAHPEPANTADPLVSIVVPTYNRGQILLERAVASALAQTYERWELVIVGDHCTDNTAELLAAVGDERIRFINLAFRHAYPRADRDRWKVAGSVPINRALFEARGEWLVYSDDDVLSAPNRIERCLEKASETGAELVFGLGEREHTSEWRPYTGTQFPSGRPPFRRGPTTHAAMMYRSYLRLFLYDSESYVDNISTDRDWMYRMGRAGVRTAALQEMLVRVPRTKSASG